MCSSYEIPANCCHRRNVDPFWLESRIFQKSRDFFFKVLMQVLVKWRVPFGKVPILFTAIFPTSTVGPGSSQTYQFVKRVI